MRTDIQSNTSCTDIYNTMHTIINKGLKVTIHVLFNTFVWLSTSSIGTFQELLEAKKINKTLCFNSHIFAFEIFENGMTYQYPDLGLNLHHVGGRESCTSADTWIYSIKTYIHCTGQTSRRVIN